MNGKYDHELEGALLAAVVAMRHQTVPADPMRIALQKVSAIDRPSTTRRRSGMWRWAVASAVAAAVAILVWRQWPVTTDQPIANAPGTAEPIVKDRQPAPEGPKALDVAKGNADPAPLRVDTETGNTARGGIAREATKGVAFAGLRVGRRLAAAPAAKILVSTGPKEPIELGQAANEGDIQSWHVHVWDLAQGGKSRALRAEVREGFAVSPDGKWLVTTAGRRIDLDADKESNLDGLADTTRVCFTPDGKSLLALTGPQADGTMRVFDWPSMTLRFALPEQFGYMFAYAFSDDSRRVALVDKNRHIRVWDLQTGAVAAVTEKAHSNSVRSIALSPDGKRLVSSGPGDEIWLWDATTGKHLKTLLAHQQYGLPGEMECLVFSRDSQRLAGGGLQNLVIWNVATGELVHRFESASTGTIAAWFSPDQFEIIAIRGFHSQRNQAGMDADVYPSMQTWKMP